VARDIKIKCAVCGTTTRVSSYTIVTPEGARVIDLCQGDAKPLLTIYSLGSGEPRRKRDGGNDKPVHAVIPVD
jgi:hypothetical protein